MADRQMATPSDDSVEKMVLDLDAVVELTEASLCRYFDNLIKKKEPSLPAWLKPSTNIDFASAAFKSLVKSLSLMPKEKMKAPLTKEELFPNIFTQPAATNTETSDSDDVIRKGRKRQRSDRDKLSGKDKRFKTKDKR